MGSRRDCQLRISDWLLSLRANSQSPIGILVFVVPEETESCGKLFSGADLSIPRRSAAHANLYSLSFENNELANLRCEPS